VIASPSRIATAAGTALCSAARNSSEPVARLGLGDDWLRKVLHANAASLFAL
jgi:hypothetical protein